MTGELVTVSAPKLTNLLKVKSRIQHTILYAALGIPSPGLLISDVYLFSKSNYSARWVEPIIVERKALLFYHVIFQKLR